MHAENATYLVTGGAGFIGSNFIHYLYDNGLAGTIVNLDKLTYAGNLANLKKYDGYENYHFIQGDICDKRIVDYVFSKFKPDYVINFAAESHVDRSIGAPDDFIKTDIFGAFTLLEAARKYQPKRFIQISTDEVYGSIDDGSFRETDQLMPTNPYSASKAGADRLAYSYYTTYELPVIITRASNNFGPYQFPEKLVPLFVTNALEDEFLPLYGDGKNIRDWLYVTDHCAAIQFIIENGNLGEVYNIGGGNERMNIEITSEILRVLDKPDTLIKPVKDRPGHDRRYSLDGGKLEQLGWKPDTKFSMAMEDTIHWYADNEEWWQPLKSGEYKKFYQKQYKLG